MNNWYVVTGAPCSGKTTLLKLLAQRGYETLDEAARVLIDQEMAKGKTLKEIRKDELDFQKKVLDMKIETESKLSPEATIFFDRGIPDSEAYYRLLGVVLDTTTKELCRKCLYKKVFLLDLLDFKKDYARVENETKQKEIQKLLVEVYTSLGVPVIRVPVFKTKTERMEFVLNNL